MVVRGTPAAQGVLRGLSEGPAHLFCCKYHYEDRIFAGRRLLMHLLKMRGAAGVCTLGGVTNAFKSCIMLCDVGDP